MIPSRERHRLLLERALPSALGQSLSDLEVIVVVDGPDPDTELALARIRDPRLRVIVLPQQRGAAQARNVGVDAARAPWIALLDDDDEWFPYKLHDQLAVAAQTPGLAVVVCPWITRTPQGDFPNPSRLPEPGERLDDYMLARRSALEETNGLISSVLLAPRQLLLEVPFDPALPKHQDWDWLLRVARHPQMHLAFTHRTAAVWYYGEERPSISRQLNWQSSLAWARGHYAVGTLSARAYVGFINSHVAPAGQVSRDRGVALTLLSEVIRAGPRPFELLRLGGNLLATTETRTALRAVQKRWQLFGRRARLKVTALPGSGEAGPVARPPLRRITLIDPLDSGHHIGYAVVLARELGALGLEVHVIGSSTLVRQVLAEVPETSGEVMALYPTGLREYYRLSRGPREWSNLMFLRRSLTRARSRRADVVHLLYLDGFMLALLGALLTVKRVPRLRATLHWLYFSRAFRPGFRLGEGLHSLMLWLLGRRGVRILVHSPLLASLLRGVVPVDTGAYFSLPPELTGSERDRRARTLRSQLDLESGAKVMLAFGGTRFDKGSDLALRALAELPDEYYLLIVGPARDLGAPELGALARQLGVASRLRLVIEHVPDEDVEGYFAAADLVVLPYRSNFAGQSGPLLIAASLGMPVVASNTEVLRETVTEYRLGALFPAGDYLALAQAVLQVLRSPPTSDTWRFLDEHRSEVFADAIFSSYRQETGRWKLRSRRSE